MRCKCSPYVNYKLLKTISNIYRISHELWFDMIYIQRVVGFLSPSLGEGIENTQRVGYKSYQTTTHGRFFLSHVNPPSPHLCFLSTLHSVAMSLVRNVTSTHKERVLQQYTNKSCLRRILFNC